MSEKELTIKEKAKLYDNWLKFVNGKGYTEIFAEPQKIKEKLDKLNKEVESHKGTGIVLSKENQILIRQKRVLEEENKKLKADVRHERETVEIANRQYIDLKQKIEELYKKYLTSGKLTDEFDLIKGLKEILKNK